MASSQTPRKAVIGRAQKVTDKRRRNRSVEVQRSHIILSSKNAADANGVKSRSNIDPSDVVAAKINFMENQSLNNPNSRCSSWASLNSSQCSSVSGSRTDLTLSGDVDNDDDSGISVHIDHSPQMSAVASLEIPPFQFLQKRRKLPRVPSSISRSALKDEPLPQYCSPPTNSNKQLQQQQDKPVSDFNSGLGETYGFGESAQQQQQHITPLSSPRLPRVDPDGKIRPGTWHSNQDVNNNNTNSNNPNDLRPNSFHSTDMLNNSNNTPPDHMRNHEITDLIPLRAEETSFEGVTLSQLEKLQDLQLQRQMLKLEESKLANAMSPSTLFSPRPMYLPSFTEHMDVSTQPNQPPTSSTSSIADATLSLTGALIKQHQQQFDHHQQRQRQQQQRRVNDTDDNEISALLNAMPTTMTTMVVDDDKFNDSCGFGMGDDDYDDDDGC